MSELVRFVPLVFALQTLLALAVLIAPAAFAFELSALQSLLVLLEQHFEKQLEQQKMPKPRL